MGDVIVIVETPLGITLESCVFPKHYSPDVFIPDLVSQLGLPYDTESGVSARDSILANYALYNVRHGRHLLNHEKLDEAGVRDGDILRLVSLHESPPVSAPPVPQVGSPPEAREEPLAFVSVTIETPHLIIENCMIPDHFTAERVVQDLAEELSLPLVTVEGTRITYSLLQVDSRSVLPTQKMLRESGIKNGETLRLISDYYKRYALAAE